MKIAELGSEPDILEWNPWRAGKNLEYRLAGLGALILLQTSLAILKYGSWSIPHGIKHGIFSFPNICGKLDDRHGAASTAGYEALPQLSAN